MAAPDASPSVSIGGTGGTGGTGGSADGGVMCVRGTQCV
jgi:hypothetical protein